MLLALSIYRTILNYNDPKKKAFRKHCGNFRNSNISNCGVCGHEGEGLPRNGKVPSLIPKSGCQLWGCSLGNIIKVD